MIPFNIPAITGQEAMFLQQAIANAKLCGDGPFTKQCSEWLEATTHTHKALLTTSCTHALEMAAILANIQAGDEVIMSSFTFVSSSNPFVLRGAKIVFVDIRPDTMNIDERLIDAAITSKTKVIVPMHYAGVACEMDTIMEIAAKHNLLVIEDAAQALGATYKGKPLGTIGQLGAYSFHETKNIHCGEGGALLINDKALMERAEIIREKGTNRARFLRGQIDKYTWVDIGSSYLPSELNAAFLWAQLQQITTINSHRKAIWDSYFQQLSPLQATEKLELPIVPEDCLQNGHLFYIKLKDLNQRQLLINYLKENQVQTVFHYVPLHTAEAGLRFGRFVGEDKYTTRESERLLRLPLYYSLSISEITRACELITQFFKQ